MGAALLVAGFVAAPLAAQEAPQPAPEEHRPNPDDDITVDFVQKDIHTVMHYIALRSGLQINVDGQISANLTVMYRDVNPKEAIRSICKANELEYVEDGKFIIIKRRVQQTGLANVVKGEAAGRFNVSFESHELVAAIMEVGKITQTNVLVPTTIENELAGPATVKDEEAKQSFVVQIQKRRISMYMRETEPDVILRRLAELGGMELKVENGNYIYGYKALRMDEEGPEGPAPIDMKLVSRDWVLPGANVSQVKAELTPLLTTRGKCAIDPNTAYVLIIDDEKNMANIASYMDKVTSLTEAKVLEDAAKADDPLVVREFATLRDVNDATVAAGLAGLLSPDGRAVGNPDRGTMVIYDRRSRMPNIEKYMMFANTEPEQVMITGKLIEVSLDEYMGYGLQMFTSHTLESLDNGVLSVDGRDSAAGTVGGLFGQPTGFEPYFATFVSDRLNIRLELLANEGKVKTLSQPTQMVSNRKTARIEVGQEVPYLQIQSSGGGSATATIAFKEVSIVMDVTPVIMEGGLIRLQVTVTVREVVGTIAIQGNNTPIISKRESKTDLFVRDGETMAMGGMIRERERTEENGLPFLKDIPFLGYLFKTANQVSQKTDLLFFLRPQIVTTRGAVSTSGLNVERTTTPVIYEDGDEEKATLRPGRFRKAGNAEKPAHYNESARPKKPADVKPGA